MIYRSNWETNALEAARPHFVRVAQARRAMANLNSEELEAVAEAAIAMLDALRDPDEDQCPAGDDGCGLFCGGEYVGARWGSDDDAAKSLRIPEYGVDQREVMGRFGVAFRVD